jgi:Family of unknown function (DUF6072)
VDVSRNSDVAQKTELQMTDSGEHKPLIAGLQFFGECLVPGGSNLVKGNIRQAAVHAVLGMAARAFFGMPGLLLVSSNSIAKARTGRYLHEYLEAMWLGERREIQPAPAAPPMQSASPPAAPESSSEDSEPAQRRAAARKRSGARNRPRLE